VVVVLNYVLFKTMPVCKENLLNTCESKKWDTVLCGITNHQNELNFQDTGV
jgi:hypothetical protein